MLRGGVIGTILMLLLVGCDMGGQRVIQERQDRELAQWHKERVSQLVSAIAKKYTESQSGLVIRSYDVRVHIVGEVDSYETQRRIFDELSAVPYAEVYPFALVRQGKAQQRTKDEELQRKISKLISEHDDVRVYVVDGQVVLEGRMSPTSYHERLRGQLADLDKRVPGARQDPYLVIYARDIHADMGDWAPPSYVPLPPVRPASLSGAVNSTLNLGSRLTVNADMQEVVPPAKPVRPTVASPQPAPRRTEARQRSSGDGMTVFGSLLQAAGQIAQVSGSGQGYESGLVMQGVGAVLVGDNAAAQQAVANAEQYGESNRALKRQQAAQQQQEYAQQQAVAAAEAARQHEWNMQNQRALDSQRRTDETASASPQVNLGISAVDDVPSTPTGGGSQTMRYAKPSNHCLSGSRNTDGSISLRNTCNTNISVMYCYVQVARPNQQQYTCRPKKDYWSKEGVTYATQDPGTVAPGGTMSIAPGGGSVAYVGCATPYIFPIISRVSSADVRGYCVKP